MSRDRQRPLEAEGSWWGNQDQELPPKPASSSQAVLLTLDRAGGTLGASPPVHSPVPYQGSLAASLASCWAPVPLGGSIFCLGQREANLGGYTSHTETVLGPLDLTGAWEGTEMGTGVSGTHWGGGHLISRPLLWSLKVNV